MNEMGKRIRMKRTEKGMTMEQLASALGVKASAINKYEKGIVENIKRSTIQEMALILECNPAWLMGFDAEQDSNNDYITLEEGTFIETYRQLSMESRKQLMLYIAFLKDQENNK